MDDIGISHFTPSQLMVLERNISTIASTLSGLANLASLANLADVDANHLLDHPDSLKRLAALNQLSQLTSLTNLSVDQLISGPLDALDALSAQTRVYIKFVYCDIKVDIVRAITLGDLTNQKLTQAHIDQTLSMIKANNDSLASIINLKYFKRIFSGRFFVKTC